MQEKEGFTGIRDLDSELLLKMDDREFIKTCSLNNYFINLCKRDNYLLFKKKLQFFYPDTLNEKTLKEYMPSSYSWKQYYASAVKAVAGLKERYNYDFVSGDPFIQLKIFQQNTFGGLPRYKAIFSDSIKANQFPLLVYALQYSPNMTIGIKHLLHAAALRDMKILKYLISHGADINSIKGLSMEYYLNNRDYLKSLGVF